MCVGCMHSTRTSGLALDAYSVMNGAMCVRACVYVCAFGRVRVGVWKGFKGTFPCQFFKSDSQTRTNFLVERYQCQWQMQGRQLGRVQGNCDVDRVTWRGSMLLIECHLGDQGRCDVGSENGRQR